MPSLFKKPFGLSVDTDVVLWRGMGVLSIAGGGGKDFKVDSLYPASSNTNLSVRLLIIWVSGPFY